MWKSYENQNNMQSSDEIYGEFGNNSTIYTDLSASNLDPYLHSPSTSYNSGTPPYVSHSQESYDHLYVGYSSCSPCSSNETEDIKFDEDYILQDLQNFSYYDHSSPSHDQSTINVPDIKIEPPTGLLSEMETYKIIPIMQWKGEHCLDWAAGICKENGIPPSGDNIRNMINITGAQLVTLKERDLKKFTDDVIGPILYKKIKSIKKEIKKSQAHSLIVSQETQEPSSASYTFDDQFLHGYYDGYRPIPEQSLKREELDSVINDLMECALEPPAIKDDDTKFNDCDQLLDNISVVFDKKRDTLPELYIRDNERPLSPFGQENSISVPDSSLFPDIDVNSLHPRDAFIYNMAGAPQSPLGINNRRRRKSSGNRGALENVLSSSPLDTKHFLKKIPSGPRNTRQRSPKSWEFLVRLLHDPSSNPSLVKWEEEENGIFRLIKKDEIARIWAERDTNDKRTKNKTYDSFARILRHHYTTGALKAVSEKHLVYQFSESVMEIIRRGQIP